MSRFLPELADLGYSGVQNFPTVGLLEGLFRQNLEETGMGYGLEVDMIALARKLEMFSSPYVFNPAEATAMADAGADMIVAHLGTTNQGFIGAQSVVPMNEAAEMVGAMYEAAIAANPDVLVICHGGPVHGPDEAAFIIKSVPGVAGFYGASSIERLPVEPAIVARVQEFKAIAV
jgi:predicted TIM-barrel enzyme